MAVPNTVLFSSMAGALFGDLSKSDGQRERRTELALAPIFTSLALLNLAWTLEAGGELIDRKTGGDDPRGLRSARVHIAFASIDTIVRVAGLCTGMVLLIEPGGQPDIGSTAVGIALVVTNGILVPLHVGTLIVLAKELRLRKQGRRQYTGDRVTPIPGGFAF